MENMDTIINSHPDTHLNETTETDFNSTLLDDGTLFSSHAVNTIIDLESNDQNNEHNNNNNVTNNTTDNTHFYQNHQHRQPVNSNEMTQNSDLLNTTLPTLPNVNTPLPRLNRQNSVYFNTEQIFLNDSIQPTPATNQIIQITPQKLGTIVRRLNSQSTTQITNAPAPFYSQAASIQTPSPKFRRNAQKIYPYVGGPVPMQQSLRPFDVTEPTYTIEDFLRAITANMVMTAGPEQTDSPYHEA